MTNPIEEVMNELGWGDGFRIPIANEENKRLEEEIERKNRLRGSLRQELENLNERVAEIRRHAATVRQEHGQRQQLLAAHSGQVETERQLYRLAQMDESRLGQELKLRERECREMEEKATGLGQRAAKLTASLEATRRAIRIDKDELASWEDRLARKDERNIMIEHFVKSDEKTFKKIELERQSLSEKAETYRQAVVKADGDVRELELILDKSARCYGQAIKDRRQLMDQWSQSVRVLGQRDKAIYAALQEINSLRETAKEKMDVYQEAERFFDIHVAENKELEDGIKTLEKEIARHREEHLKLAESIDALSIELLAKNKQIQDLTRRTNDTRSNLKRKKIEIDGKRTKLDDCKRRIAELREILKNIDGQTMNVEEKTRQLQDMLEKEEKRKSSIRREIKRQQESIQRANARLKELENENEVTRLQQQAEGKRWDQLVAEQAKQEARLKETKDCAYQADFELQKCEMRLQQMLGQERDKAELEAKRAKISHLSQMLQEKSETQKTLEAQVAQAEHEVRRLTNEIASNKQELQQLTDKRQELCLLIEGGEKQMRAAQSDYENRKVEESILRLKVREAEKFLAKVDDKLYDLEKFALEMEAVMLERSAEIKAQKESLALQKRLAQTECGELRGQLAERRARLQQLQARYDLLIASLGTNPEDGEPLTATYLKIQSAQERYLLQERGDQLDRTIRKTEHEIQSMENTLRLVNACNSKYKSSLAPVEEDGPERAEQRQLDEELFQALETRRQSREALERLEEDCKRMEENCAQLDEDVKRAKEEKESKLQLVADFERQINEQQEKISRADKSTRRILREIQNKCACTPDESILQQERDIALRELQDMNQLALQRIAEFTIRHVEAEAYVKKLLAERGIALPQAYYLRQQQQSSRCESAASSVPSTGRLAAGRTSSRDTIGSLVQFQPQFDALDSGKSSKATGRASQRQSLKKK